MSVAVSFIADTSQNREREKLTIDELRSLGARASTIQERLLGDYCEPLEGRGQEADAGMKSWESSAAGGDPALFRQMCRFRNLDVKAVKPMLGPVAARDEVAMPLWCSDFLWLFEALQQTPDAACSASLANDPRLPYEELFYSLVAQVRRRRNARAEPEWLALLSGEALSDLDRALLHGVTEICARGLNDKLNLRRYSRGSRLGMLSFAAMQPQPGDLDQEVSNFIAELRTEGLKSFFLDRPVLARLISRLVSQWQDVTLEFLQRLHNDLPDEIGGLTGGVNPGRVARISAGLSDLHNGGRSVYKVTFEAGITLGYKPRDLSLDNAWNRLLNWLDSEEAPASAGHPACLLRDGYGWVEWMVPRACANQAEAKEFFRRTGATLCLIRMLQGIDFHLENVMACGTVPVPVDLETVIRARIREEPQATGAAEAFTKALRIMDDSVFSTGYLPGWISMPGGGAMLMGGLDIYQDPNLYPEANSHDRSALDGQGEPAEAPNLPSLNGKVLQAQDYADDIAVGYRSMFAFLRTRGPEMAKPGGPLSYFDEVSFRPILRPTRVYAMLQQRALGRTAVIDGAAWSLHFDFLYQSSLTADAALPLAKACSYEVQAMADHNIPYFTAEAGSTDLRCGDGTLIPGFFTVACLDEIRARFSDLRQEVQDRDLLTIEQALRITQQAAPSPLVEGEAVTEGSITRHSEADLITRACGLADAIESSAIRASGAATWIAPTPVTSDERLLQQQPLGPALFCGTIGIAVFLAALNRITGVERYRDLASASIAALLEQSKDESMLRNARRMTNLGLGDGLGGMVYGLELLSHLLKEPELQEAAGSFAGLITEEKIAACAEPGLYSGLAGAMIALLRHDPSGKETAVRASVQSCGEALLKQRRDTHLGGRAWLNRQKHPSIGLMHGTSGIAMALAMAGIKLSLPEFQDAALEALDVERSLYQQAGYWPDLRDLRKGAAPSDAPSNSDFANGAAGVGAARLRLIALVGATPDLAGDLDAATAQVRSAAGVDRDGLFEGNAGQIIFLTEAARYSGDRALGDRAGAKLTDMLERAHIAGSFKWQAGKDRDNPGFFNGAAGVGMALLSMVRPDVVALRDAVVPRLD